MSLPSRKTSLAVVLALAVVIFSGTPVLPTTDFLFVTTTDYSTGSCSIIDMNPPSYTVTKNVASINSDAIARYYNGYIYVINRFGADNIQILDPNNGFSTVRQFSTGNQSNPVDVAFAAPNKMYVSRAETNAIWIMNPQTGAQTGSIDLSSLADGDGICEMAYMLLVGDRLFVAIQRLDRNFYWTPAGTSYIAVIDTDTDTLIDVNPGAPGTQSIALANADPYSEIQLDPWSGYLYVAGVEFWGLSDGGVELIDQVALSSAGTIFTESAAGGDMQDVEIVCPTVGYAIVQNASFHTVLIMFDPSTGTKTRTVYSPGDYVMQDVEQGPTGDVFLTDRTPTAPGVRIYDALTGDEITSAPIDVGLPPFNFTFSVPLRTGVVAPPAVASMGQNFPNPFNPSTVIPFSLEIGARVSIEVFDAAGRRVAVLLDEYRPAGEHEARWDGLAGGSRPAPSGVYFARLRAAGFTDHKKLILLK